MKPRSGLLTVLFLFLLFLSGCQEEPYPELRFDNFKEELEYLVDKNVKMGASVGIIDKDQSLQEYYFGSISNDNTSPPDSRSLFEIGSITKTFTATLLAQMILDGKIALADELESFLILRQFRFWYSPGVTVVVPDGKCDKQDEDY